MSLLELSEQAKQVACGLNHILILSSESHRVYAFGENREGVLGLGHRNPSERPVLVKALEHEEVSQIAAGRHSAAITAKGKLFVWGPVFSHEKVLAWPTELETL